MIHQAESESPQPVAEAESLVGVAMHDLLAVLSPVLDWYQSDEEDARPPLDIIRDIVADLQTDRAENLRYRPALERIRDTSVAMLDSLRCYPKSGTVILAEGPGRIRDAACDALYPANSELTQPEVV